MSGSTLLSFRICIACKVLKLNSKKKFNHKTYCEIPKIFSFFAELIHTFIQLWLKMTFNFPFDRIVSLRKKDEILQKKIQFKDIWDEIFFHFISFVQIFRPKGHEMCTKNT
jgi:hypothetical protein